jgi:hypothetical protein
MSAPIPTLFFCTSFCRNEAVWRARPRRWLDHHLGLPVAHDAVFVLDDASPFVATDDDVMVLETLPDTLPATPAAFVYRFAAREGRAGVMGHRGWWRSFLYSLTIARRYGYARIVHVESDAYLLSRRIVEHINAIDHGWTVFWCPRYNCPEPSLQVIASDQFDAMAEVAARGLDKLTQGIAEMTLPFTHIERAFTGNRYGEFRKAIPGYADFACQVNSPAMPTVYRA